MSASSENPNIVVAVETADKFEFYFLALVFTVLGFSIQTAALSRWGYQFIFEILSWCALLMSGLAGLWRLFWKPVTYNITARIQKQEGMLQIFTRADVTGEDVQDEHGRLYSRPAIKEQIENYNKSISRDRGVLDSIENRLQLKYRIHRYSFVVGIVSLIVSRSLAGIDKMLITSGKTVAGTITSEQAAKK